MFCCDSQLQIDLCCWHSEHQVEFAAPTCSSILFSVLLAGSRLVLLFWQPVRLFECRGYSVPQWSGTLVWERAQNSSMPAPTRPVLRQTLVLKWVSHSYP